MKGEAGVIQAPVRVPSPLRILLLALVLASVAAAFRCEASVTGPLRSTRPKATSSRGMIPNAEGRPAGRFQRTALQPPAASRLPAWRAPSLLEALAGPRGRSLGELLATQRREHREALVTGGFWDPRGVSRYRSKPGTHYGYDIAMPAGTRVRAAWAGHVVRITPWSEGEHGVTVGFPEGGEVTYGHVVPLVQAGQCVEAGDAVGTVAMDHVDVKMRDPAGNFVDFGREGAVARDPANEWLAARARHERAGECLARLEAEVRLLESTAVLGDDTRACVARQHGRDVQLLAAGLISRRQAQARARDHEARVARAQRARAHLGTARNELAAAGSERAESHACLVEAQDRALRSGLSWRDVETRVTQALARNEALRKKVAEEIRQATGSTSTAERPRADRARLERLDRLHRAGLISPRRFQELTTGDLMD